LDSIPFIPGISTEDIKLISSHFKINDIVELKKLAQRKEIRKLKGFNSKTEMKIIRGIKLLETKPPAIPIGIASDFAILLIKELEAWPQVSQVLLVGELRRGIEEVKSIEILAEAKLSDMVQIIQKSKIVSLRKVENVKIEVNTLLGLPLNLHISTRKSWGTNSILNTGSPMHLRALLNYAGTLPVFSKEEKVYSYLNLPWIDPEIRETGFEVQFAQGKLLPKLIDLSEIKGDLHLHSTWSDGSNSIEEIILAAIKMGYKYIAITDHSQSLKVAGGLAPEELCKQIGEINTLQLKYPKIRILKGVEVDILADGTLDFTDDILNRLDIVIASVHSQFQMSEEDMTKRIIKALKHPLVKILAHPTGRVLGKRPGYQVDIKEIIETAARYKKVLEINASPDRLDLRDQHLQIAKTKGVKIAVNTDAHHIQRMQDMFYGVQTAKRGWQTNKDIINSWSYEKMENYFKSI